MARLPKGCPFCARCTFAQASCRDQMPQLMASDLNPAVLRACHESAAVVMQAGATGVEHA